jgi:hypothetical protein
MRRLSIGLTAGVLTAALGSVVLTGCGGPVDQEKRPIVRSKKKDKDGDTRGSGGGVKARKPLGKPDDYKGVVTGYVKWEGPRPELHETPAMSTDKDYCLTGKKGDFQSEVKPYETYQQNWRVGKNDQLGNVFVWIEAPKGFDFRPPEAVLPKEETVTIHQPHCAFLPHCSVLRGLSPDGTKIQTLTIMNDARVLHNSKVTWRNGERNPSLPPWSGKGKPSQEVFSLKPEKTPITVSCGVHGWMSAYVRVFNHPFATVSSVGADLSNPKDRKWENEGDPKFGTFEIRGVPVGAQVKLFAWHEKLEYLLGKNGKDITIKADPKENEQVITARLP